MAPVAVNMGNGDVAYLEPDLFDVDRALLAPLTVELAVSFIDHCGRRVRISGVPGDEVAELMSTLESCGARDVRSC